MHVQVRPFGLQPFLQPVQDLGGAAGGGGHEEPVLVEAERDAVVEDHPVRGAHDAVAGGTRRELLERVRVDAVQELARVLAADLDLAQGGGVHEAHGFADGGAFAQDRGVHVLARLRVVPGALPLADVLEEGAVGDVPGVDGGEPGRVEELPALASGEGSERHRGEGGAVRGGADLPDAPGRFAGLAECRGDDADRVHPGGLALVVGGADRGVALDVFHRAHAGAGGAEHVGHGLVALEVDEVVVPVVRAAFLSGDQPELAGRGGRFRLGKDQRFGGRAGVFRIEAGGAGRRGPGGDAFGDTVVEVEAAPAGAGHLLVGDHAAGHERRQVIVPADLALALGVQVHHGGPAAGDGEQVAGELFDAGGEFAVVVDAPDGDAGEALLPGGVGDGAADQHPRAGCGRCGGCFAQLRTGVHDGFDADAGGPEVGGQGVGAVVGGADDHAGTGGHGVAVEVAADRGGEHDAGAVVVFEDQRAFVGAGGQDDLGGADVPDPLAGHAGRGRGQEVVRPVLGRDDVVGVVGAEGGWCGSGPCTRPRRSVRLQRWTPSPGRVPLRWSPRGPDRWIRTAASRPVRAGRQ